MLKRRREEVWTSHRFPSCPLILSLSRFFQVTPFRSVDETCITLLKKVIIFPYSPRRHLFNSSHITNSIGMMLSGMWDRIKFALFSAGRPNGVKRPEVTPRNVLWSDHFNMRAPGFEGIRLLLCYEHGDPEQPKSTRSLLHEQNLLVQEMKPDSGRSCSGSHMTKIEK